MTRFLIALNVFAFAIEAARPDSLLDRYALWPLSTANGDAPASAGVFGMLLAYALIFPQRRVMLLCPPIPMPAWLFATAYAAAYAAIQLLLGVLRTAPRVAHFAHLGGMIGAVALIFFWSCRPHHDALGPYNVFVAADIFGQVCWNLIRDRSTTRDAIGSAAT